MAHTLKGQEEQPRQKLGELERCFGGRHRWPLTCIFITPRSITMMNNASNNKSPMLKHLPIAAMADFGNLSQSDKLFQKSPHRQDHMLQTGKCWMSHPFGIVFASGQLSEPRPTLANPIERMFKHDIRSGRRSNSSPSLTAETFQQTSSQTVLFYQ